MNDQNKRVQVSKAQMGVADGVQLLCAIGVLLAFMLLPWVVSATGWRVLQGTSDVPQSVQYTALLPLIPLASLLALVMTVFGIIRPRRKRLLAWATMATAVLCLLYFVYSIVTNQGIEFVGSGYWIALLATVGLAVQVLLPRPKRDRR